MGNRESKFYDNDEDLNVIVEEEIDYIRIIEYGKKRLDYLEKRMSQERFLRKKVEEEKKELLEKISSLEASLEAPYRATEVVPENAIQEHDGTAFGPRGLEYYLKHYAEKVQDLNLSDQERNICEKQLDNYSKLLFEHPDYIKRKEEEYLLWKEQQLPMNKEALSKLEAVFETSTKKIYEIEKENSKKGRRLLREKTLRFLWYTPEFISKLKNDLRSTYSYQNLSLIEMRAISMKLPKEFNNDHEGTGREWLEGFNRKLRELVERSNGKEFIFYE